MGHSKGSLEKEVHSNTDLPKKDRNISHKQPKLTSRRTGGTITNEAQNNRRKEIIKIRAELNDIETKRTIQRINKSRSLFFEKINKIDKSLTQLIKRKKKSQRTQTNKLKN